MPDEEERVVYPPFQEETVTPWGEGLPLLGARDLLLRGRIPRLRCTHPKAHTTHGRTSTTLEQEAPGDRSSRARFRPKAYAWGSTYSPPLPLYYPLCSL